MIEPVFTLPVVTPGVVVFAVAGAVLAAVGAVAVFPPVPVPLPVFADALVRSELAFPPLELALLLALLAAAFTPPTAGFAEPVAPPPLAPTFAGLTVLEPMFTPDRFVGVMMVPSPGPMFVEPDEVELPPFPALELLPEFEIAGVWPVVTPLIDTFPVDVAGVVAPGLVADALLGCVVPTIGTHSVPQSADACCENAPNTASAAMTAIA